MEDKLTIAEAKENGFIRGTNIASWVDIPEIGMKLPNHIDWVGIGEIENEQDQMDAMELMASESESNDRSFTPFEHTAHEINEHENADELWEAFDEGILEGIRSNIKKRMDQYKE